VRVGTGPAAGGSGLAMVAGLSRNRSA